jgi:putative hemolysin
VDISRRFLQRRFAVAPHQLFDLDLASPSTSRKAQPEKPLIEGEMGHYRIRLAQSAADREDACRLRFKVFNIELGEGLKSSYKTGIDTDQFDLVCDHLIVEEKSTQRVVGTYRMQSGATALRNYGYYSAQEFDFSPFEPLRPQILELGRASIDREHRTSECLTLLWRGIAQFASRSGLRYLVGCSSLNSQNPCEGWAMYRKLEGFRVPPEYMTHPMAAYACPMDTGNEPSPNVPKLLKTYMAVGARIAAEPAWDREFGTIDFLTFCDLEQLSTAARNRFFGPLSQ